MRALSRVCILQKVFTYDQNEDRARQLALKLSAELGISVTPIADVREAVRLSDLCITCTTSRAPLLQREDVGLGTFIAAVGADNPQKQELDPALMGTTIRRPEPRIVSSLNLNCCYRNGRPTEWDAPPGEKDIRDESWGRPSAVVAIERP